MYDFKLEGGEWFKEGFQKLLSQESNLLRESLDLEISLPKHKAKSRAPEKQSETIGCLYQFTNIKTEFKELKDRENAHRDLYWFTINPELHPVFSETTKEFH